MKGRCRFIILLFVLSACATNVENANVTSINVNVGRISSIEEFIDGDMEYLCLETSEECMISEISKILIVNDTLYIMDKPRRTLFLFNKNNGKFLGKIAKTGRGPAEYIDLNDFDVFGSNIYILSYADKKINIYSPDGQCLQSVKLLDKYTKLKVVNAESVWLFAENSNISHHNYVKYNLNSGEICAEYDFFDEEDDYLHNVSPFCGICQDGLYVAKYFDNCIYRLNDSGYVSMYKLDMNIFNIPQKELSKKRLSELSTKYRGKESMHKIIYIDIDESSLVMIVRCYFGDYGVRDCLIKYDLNTDKSLFYRIGDKREVKYPFLTSVDGCCSNTIVTAMSPNAYKRVIDKCNIDFDCIENLPEQHNPILFMHKLRH